MRADIRYPCHGIVNQFRPDRGPERPCSHPAKYVVPSNIRRVFVVPKGGPRTDPSDSMRVWPIRVCGHHNRAWLRTVRI